MRGIIIAKRGRKELIEIKRKDRRHHIYILGKTGMGKSTLLLTMILQDIESNQGLGVLDPHGDLAEKILSYIPKRRIQDTIYFNPQDKEYPFCLNLFEGKPKELLASGLISVFYQLWKDSWGPRLEHFLRHTLLALLEYPSATLLSIPRLLQDEDYRRKVLAKVKDPEVRHFWEEEYSSYERRFRLEAISPILNKAGAFIANPIVRNILCQGRRGLDFSRLMNKGQILIVNLPKGTLGEDNQRLLGSLILMKLQLAALERARIPEERRRDFYLYVDEFYNFITSSFISILSEARKFRLNLILAHQYLDQLEPELKGAIFGNIGTIISFRLGAKDAKIIEEEFSEANVKAEDLVNLPKFKVHLRLTQDGVPRTEFFSAETLKPPPPPPVSNKERIIELSRERFCQHRSQVERKIKRWFKVSPRISVRLEK